MKTWPFVSCRHVNIVHSIQGDSKYFRRYLLLELRYWFHLDKRIQVLWTNILEVQTKKWKNWRNTMIIDDKYYCKIHDFKTPFKINWNGLWRLAQYAAIADRRTYGRVRVLQLRSFTKFSTFKIIFWPFSFLFSLFKKLYFFFCTHTRSTFAQARVEEVL